MIKENISINNIPAILWGEKSPKLFIAVHGNMSAKDDVPIALLAEEAIPSGYQVLSFDLPEHGDRKAEPVLCKVQNVKQNPINKWNKPTSILYGKKDELCEYDTVASFAEAFHCNLEIDDNAGHYFHTQEQLKSYKAWLIKHVIL